MAPDRLLTVKEVAAWLRVSQAFVYAHASKERRPYLQSVKIGKSVRFRRTDVEAFISLCERLKEAECSI
jgi:excisionase family DNA binding protein